MRYRILIGVSLLLVLTIVLLLTTISNGRLNSEHPRPTPKGSLYAFQDDKTSTVYVASRTKIVASLQGQSPVFSPNGRYVLSSTTVALYLYDLQTGLKYNRTFIYDPNCLPQAIGGSISNSYLYVADPKLIRYTLPGFSHGTPVPAHLPPGPICPIGHIGNDALVLVGVEKGWELYEVSPEGASRHLGHDPLWTVNEEAPEDFFVFTDRAANGDPAVAYDYWRNSQGFFVNVLDLRTNNTFQVDDAQLGLPLNGRGSANSARVEDMWWSHNGHLFAVMSSYNNNSIESPQQVWRLGDHKWIAWDSRSLVSDRPLANGSSIILMAQATEDTDFIGIYSGDLYLQTLSKSRLIWRKVIGTITIPSEEAGDPSR